MGKESGRGVKIWANGMCHVNIVLLHQALALTHCPCTLPYREYI